MHERELDTATTAGKIRVMQQLGVPYPEGYDQQANADLLQQAREITARLKTDGIETTPNKEVIAIIAYMQRMGKDIEAIQTAQK